MPHLVVQEAEELDIAPEVINSYKIQMHHCDPVISEG